MLLTWLLGVLVAVPLARGVWLLVGYLSGNAFPQPLSPPDEKAALEALRRGDPGAQQRLVEHNLRLVAHLVKKFENTGEDPEDLIDIGAIGLIKAVRTFDPDKGVRLATYAARCIENESLSSKRRPPPCLSPRPRGCGSRHHVSGRPRWRTGALGRQTGAACERATVG